MRGGVSGWRQPGPAWGGPFRSAQGVGVGKSMGCSRSACPSCVLGTLRRRLHPGIAGVLPADVDVQGGIPGARGGAHPPQGALSGRGGRAHGGGDAGLWVRKPPCCATHIACAVAGSTPPSKPRLQGEMLAGSMHVQTLPAPRTVALCTQGQSTTPNPLACMHMRIARGSCAPCLL